jgi:hypothetical protein
MRQWLTRVFLNNTTRWSAKTRTGDRSAGFSGLPAPSFNEVRAANLALETTAIVPG